MLVAVYNPQYFSYVLVTYGLTVAQTPRILNTVNCSLKTNYSFLIFFYTTPESFTIFPKGNTFPELLSDKLVEN